MWLALKGDMEQLTRVRIPIGRVAEVDGIVLNPGTRCFYDRRIEGSSSGIAALVTEVRIVPRWEF